VPAEVAPKAATEDAPALPRRQFPGDAGYQAGSGDAAIPAKRQVVAGQPAVRPRIVNTGEADAAVPVVRPRSWLDKDGNRQFAAVPRDSVAGQEAVAAKKEAGLGRFEAAQRERAASGEGVEARNLAPVDGGRALV
jgi:hypothetical protein